MKKEFKKSIASDIPVLVYFSASWCTSCEPMAPIFQQLKEEIEDGFEFLELDVDEVPNLAKKYKVRIMPTLMIFKNKTLLWQHSGMIQKADLLAVIREYL